MASKTIKLIECGTIVRFKNSKIEGIITAISIRFKNIMYEVTIDCDGARKGDFVNEGEFDVIDNQGEHLKQIGFKSHK